MWYCRFTILFKDIFYCGFGRMSHVFRIPAVVAEVIQHYLVGREIFRSGIFYCQQ